MLAYCYDPLGRLTAADYTSGTFYHYSYDAVGNRTAASSLAMTTVYTYDSANRLASVDGVDYTWDTNGNLLSDGANTYSYDAANRLTGLTDASTTYSYAYNGLGARISQAEGSTTTRYTLDLAAPLSQVLDDSEQVYLYGNGRIGQENLVSRQYFLGDALTSLRLMVDEIGTIIGSKSYQPYGELTSQWGIAESDYGFTNEYTSQGLIYLRARWYSPQDSRFLTRDTWQGDYNKPMSYNAWLYGYSNPVKYVDPTGQNPSSAVVAALLPALVGGGAGFVIGAVAGGIYGACVYELALTGQCGCETQQQALSMTKQDWIGTHALGAGIIGGVGGAIAAYGPVGMIAVGVAGIVISGADIYNTYNIIKNETGLTTCTVTRLIIDVTAMVFSGVGIVNGIRAWRAIGSPLQWVGAPPPLSGKSALDSMYAQSRPGRHPGIREVPGANPLDWFYKIADPSSIRPHRNPSIASQGGLEGTVPGGGLIFYRPQPKSGNPAIDTFNIPGYTENWKYHFPSN